MVRMIDLIKRAESKKKEPSAPEPAAEEPEEARPGEGEESQVRLAGLFPRGAPPSAGRPRGSVLDAPEEDSGSIRTPPPKLDVKQRYCPYLGGSKVRKEVKDFPVSTNVCYAAESREKRLLRTIIHPYTPISAQRQREFCLSTSYLRCPAYQAKEKQAGKA